MSAAEAGAVKAWIIAFIVLAGIGIGTLVGVGCIVGANTCPGKSRPKQTSTDGLVLYGANCAVCHNRRGEGTGAGPSLIAGNATTLTLAGIESKIARGKPIAGMPKFSGVLTSQQIQAVAVYVVSLRGNA